MRLVLKGLLAGTAVCGLISGTAAFALKADAGRSVPAIDVALEGRPHDFLFGLSFEGAKGVAVGSHGALFTTEDGGDNWARSGTTLPQTAFLTVKTKSGRCIAAGQQGAIVRSTDCANWEVVPPVSDARLFSVDVNRSGLAVTVGEFGTVLISQDWGKTWQALSLDWLTLTDQTAEPHLYSVHVGDDGSVIIGGEFELILKSDSGGQQWHVQHKGKRSVFGIAVSPGGKMIAVGQEGLILSSADRGTTWMEVPSGTKAILTGVWIGADERKVVAVGVRAMLFSNDGGNSFAATTADAAIEGLHSSVFGQRTASGEDIAYVAGGSGRILRVNMSKQ